MIVARKNGPRLGIINLQYDGALDTADLPNPFNASAPPGLPPGFFMDPEFWPVPTAFAVAPGAIGTAITEGTPTAIAGIAAAVERLARHCDLIVGNCGYMYAARSQVQSDTPTLLSALQLLPNALESTRRPVGVLTFNRAATEKMLASHPDRSRLRIVGVDDQPGWSLIWTRDSMINGQLNVDLLRTELLGVCLKERHTGAFKDIGSLVLECTAMPQFSADLVAVLALPIWDIAAVARGLLGA